MSGVRSAVRLAVLALGAEAVGEDDEACAGMGDGAAGGARGAGAAPAVVAGRLSKLKASSCVVIRFIPLALPAWRNPDGQHSGKRGAVQRAQARYGVLQTG